MINEIKNPFADALKENAKWKTTENGCAALNTTSSAVLDLFANIGALRSSNTNGGYFDKTRLEKMFIAAYTEDTLYTTRILFYARDIRSGLGERDIPRYLYNYMAVHYPNKLRNNVQYIPEYGRFDDWYELVDTPLENTMWECMSVQFESDLENLHAGKPISLLAKWIKSPDTSSKTSRKLGCLTADKLGYPVYNFKRIVKSMRKHIGIVESKMSTNRWSDIEYSHVPSNAMKIYGNHAFPNHDGYRFESYLEDVKSGKDKINSSTLYPYDICESLFKGGNVRVAEEQWKALPDWVNGQYSAIVMADTSGSMYGRPLDTAISLALYFAERNEGAFHNMFMTFDAKPRCVIIKGNTLFEKLKMIKNTEWGGNTDLFAAFVEILRVAKENNIDQKWMPKSLIVISDMEIDQCTRNATEIRTTFYNTVNKLYAENGYIAPNLVFWTVASRQTTMHADKNSVGVQLVSGQSASTFDSVVKNSGKTPMEMMYNVLDNERYSIIT